MSRACVPVLVALLALVGCATPAPAGSDFGPSAEGQVAPLATADSAALVTEHLECDGPAEPARGVANSGAPREGSSPERALRRFVESGVFAFLPHAGYERAAESDDRVVFVYRAAGKVKVAVSVGLDGPTGGTWQVESFAACEVEETGPAVSLGPGIGVWVHDNGTILTERHGDAHCGWESVTFLQAVDREYVRDPEGVLRDWDLQSTYASDVSVPADARPSGFRHGDREIWWPMDEEAIYVVSSDGAERWPAAGELIRCR